MLTVLLKDEGCLPCDSSANKHGSVLVSEVAI